MIETPGRIEPCLFDERIPSELADLAVEIQRAAGQLDTGLDPQSAAELADFVRVMNCYYSNLIEGHKTRPQDIEKALVGAELEEETRPLAFEARAHVVVQREIDELARSAVPPSPTSNQFLAWVHRRFYEQMPDDLRFIQHPDGRVVEVVPGQFRVAGDPEVVVGRHVPPSSHRVQAFLEHFDRRYRSAESSASGRIIAIAAAHHRLNYIHPFLDGNGRVSRLMSHAMAFNAGVGGQGLWSISRGLAQGLSDRGEYMRTMDYADSPRMGDRDGRGNLSEFALREFCGWFLKVMLDQITCSTKLFDIDGLERRYCRLVGDAVDDRRAPKLVSAVLRRGRLHRGQAKSVLDTSERTARNTLKALTEAGFLTSDSAKTPVRPAFPLEYRERLFPNLFTDAASES